MTRAAFDPTPPGVGEGVAPPEPWWGNHLAEMRWQAELARLLIDPVFRGEGVPRGDGAPVVLVPGFLAGDVTLSVLRGWLNRIGYDAHGCGMLANVDCSDRACDKVHARIIALHGRTGRRVTIIGHSRGGHFAKALAIRCPDQVSQVISMGSGLDDPFDISEITRIAVQGARRAIARRDPERAAKGCFTHSCLCRYAADFRSPFPSSVPLTSLYSKGDGVVRWRACVVPYADCVEVTGSHVGLAFNRHAYREIAARLAPAGASA